MRIVGAEIRYLIGSGFSSGYVGMITARPYIKMAKQVWLAQGLMADEQLLMQFITPLNCQFFSNEVHARITCNTQYNVFKCTMVSMSELNNDQSMLGLEVGCLYRPGADVRRGRGCYE